MSWYALKIFYNRTPLILERLRVLNNDLAKEAEEEGRIHVPVEHYYALNAKGKPLVSGLLFVKCSLKEVLRIKKENDDKLLIYQDADRKPAAIAQREMDSFMAVNHQGDLVRVKSGPYAGVEGYIRRVKKNRRLFVCISGVAVVATAFMDPKNVEKVNK